jgi:hypothetical protein
VSVQTLASLTDYSSSQYRIRHLRHGKKGEERGGGGMVSFFFELTLVTSSVHTFAITAGKVLFADASSGDSTSPPS